VAVKPRYGRPHRRVRARWAPQVEAGLVSCSPCLLPIRAGEPWDLDHVEGTRDQYYGPSHSACNRATAGPPRRLRRRRAVVPVDLSKYVDDPATNTYWGPPPQLGGPPRRWSRAWFEWRGEDKVAA